MTKKCLVIDLDRCSGCDTCVVSCKYENGTALGSYWNRVITVVGGEFPDVTKYWLPVQCQQCENPQCVAVCPTGASYRDSDTGVVLIDKSKCIGCQYCMMACPYGVRIFNKEEGVVEKCTLCSHLTSTGETEPPCVHNCPTGARMIGDLDDPSSEVSKAVAAAGSAAHALPDPQNTKPSSRYILHDSIATWKELV